MEGIGKAAEAFYGCMLAAVVVSVVLLAVDIVGVCLLLSHHLTIAYH